MTLSTRWDMHSGQRKRQHDIFLHSGRLESMSLQSGSTWCIAYFVIQWLFASTLLVARTFALAVGSSSASGTVTLIVIIIWTIIANSSILATWVTGHCMNEMHGSGSWTSTAVSMHASDCMYIQKDQRPSSNSGPCARSLVLSTLSFLSCGFYNYLNKLAPAQEHSVTHPSQSIYVSSSNYYSLFPATMQTLYLYYRLAHLLPCHVISHVVVLRSAAGQTIWPLDHQMQNEI